MTTEQIQAMVVWFIFWLILFVIAPARALKAGFIVDDPPLSLKLGPFKALRVLALIAALSVGYMMPLELNLSRVNYGDLISRIIAGDLMGPVLAIALMLIGFWAVPEMTARGRISRGEAPGEWLTPALVYFRWVWMGLVLLTILGVPQAIDAIWDLLGFPLGMTQGAILPLAGMLFFMLWWGLPGMRVATAADDADPHAISSLSTVRWRGLPAFISYMAGRRSRGGKSKARDSEKLCPSCMRPIDHIEDYEGLRFDVCPHCSEVIPPVYKMSDYIEHLAERIAELAGRPSMKRHRGERQTRRALYAAATARDRSAAADLGHQGPEQHRHLRAAQAPGRLLQIDGR